MKQRIKAQKRHIYEIFLLIYLKPKTWLSFTKIKFTSIKGDSAVSNVNTPPQLGQVQSIVRPVHDGHIVHQWYVGASRHRGPAVHHVTPSVGVPPRVPDVQVLQPGVRLCPVQILVFHELYRGVVKLQSSPVSPSQIRTEPLTLETYHLLSVYNNRKIICLDVSSVTAF